MIYIKKIINQLKLSVAILAGLFSGQLIASLPTEHIPHIPHKVNSSAQTPSLANMLQKVMPSIVNVRKFVEVSHSAYSSMHNGSKNNSNSGEGVLQGSGVIIDAKHGYIITNNHVVKGNNGIVITLSDGRHFLGKLIGGDAASDIAVIQINADKLQQIEVANSDAAKVGDFVVAIGSPFGLNQTATSGIISAIGRHIGLEGYENFIQTDASINPGNSGGALVNLNGKVIGINTAILASGGGNIGIGFAIPSNMALSIANQLIHYGKVRRGLLGVLAQDLTPDLARAFGDKNADGAVIDTIVPNSLAQQVGLQAGDVVKSINNHPIKNASEVRNMIGLVQIGQKLKLVVLRNKVVKTIAFTMLDAKDIKSAEEKIYPALAGTMLTPAQIVVPLLGQIEGIVVLKVKRLSGAWQQGLRAADIIISANQQTVHSMADLQRAASRYKDHLLLRVARGDSAFYVVLKGAD